MLLVFCHVVFYLSDKSSMTERSSTASLCVVFNTVHDEQAADDVFLIPSRCMCVCIPHLQRPQRDVDVSIDAIRLEHRLCCSGGEGQHCFLVLQGNTEMHILSSVMREPADNLHWILREAAVWSAFWCILTILFKKIYFTVIFIYSQSVVEEIFRSFM